jgi:hypothetical protein
MIVPWPGRWNCRTISGHKRCLPVSGYVLLRRRLVWLFGHRNLT